MTILNLTNQETTKSQIAPKLLALKTELDKRSVVWERLSQEKKRQWIKSEKDPIMNLAFDITKYVVRNFPELVETASNG